MENNITKSFKNKTLIKLLRFANQCGYLRTKAKFVTVIDHGFSLSKFN